MAWRLISGDYGSIHPGGGRPPVPGAVWGNYGPGDADYGWWLEEGDGSSPPAGDPQQASDSVSIIIAELWGKKIDPTVAKNRLKNLGITDANIYAMVNAIVTNPAYTGVNADVGKDDFVKTDIGKGGPTTLKDIYKLGLQQHPEEAYRQFVGGQQDAAGAPFGERASRFFGSAAAEGFPLAPFLRPGAFGGKDPLEKLGAFTMPKFLGGGNDPFANVPSPFDIRQAMAQMQRPLAGMDNAQRTVAQMFQTPDANRDVFSMVSNPLSSQAGGLFGPMIRRFLQSAFDQFQEEDPSRKFLDALMQGTAGRAFQGMSGFPQTGTFF